MSVSRWPIYGAVFLLYTAASINPQTVQKHLNGEWEVHGYLQPFLVNINGGMDMFSALLKTGQIKDPLTDMHDTDYRWLAYQNWTFEHTFSLSSDQPSIQPSSHFELQWEGVDTFCDVFLNDYSLGSTSNSFLTYTWHIPQTHIHCCGPTKTNQLRLVCQSTVSMAKAIATSLKNANLEVPPLSCWPTKVNGECHVNLVRTTQASFGWDWSLALPIQGFWQLPVVIITQPSDWRFGEMFKFYAYPSRPNSTTQPWHTFWNADVSVQLVSSADVSNRKTEICVKSLFPQLGSSTLSTHCFAINANDGKNIDSTLPVLRQKSGITLWWPHGIASGPKMYTIRLTLTDKAGREMDSFERSIGFRKVELVEEPVVSQRPELGLSFYFLINEFPVYIKGANWIPSRLLPGRQPGFMRSSIPEADPLQSVEQLVSGSTTLAGINLLRVWGGGRYEPSSFYETADRNGIMIWHDMMFAVFTYLKRNVTTIVPDTIEREIREQIRRLHYHPSIIIWSTDNEVYQAIHDGWYSSSGQNLKPVYDDRFIDSIAKTIVEEEGLSHQGAAIGIYQSRRCLISSPSNGIRTERNRATGENPQDPAYGDVHYYKYVGDLWTEETLGPTRFTSEFGVQSLPSLLAWFRSLGISWENDDWNVFGNLMAHRQHHNLGTDFVKLAEVPIGQPRHVDSQVLSYFRFAYVTQLFQMKYYQTYLNMMMRHQCRLNNGETPEHPSSMGTAYWQFNDVWSAPSWSTIDAAGQWKMAHYGAVKSSYKPGLQGHIALHITSADELEIDWIPNAQPVEVASQWQPDYFLIQCYSIQHFSQTAEWRIYRDKLTDVHLSSICPVRVLKESIKSVTKRCQLTEYPQAERIINVLIYKDQTRYGGDRILMLGRPRSITNWPPTAGSPSLHITNIQKLQPKSWSHETPFQPTAAYRLTVSAKSPELYIWLELSHTLDTEHWFDENAFSLVSSSKRDLILYLHETSNVNSKSLTAAKIKGNIFIASLATLRQ